MDPVLSFTIHTDAASLRWSENGHHWTGGTLHTLRHGRFLCMHIVLHTVRGAWWYVSAEALRVCT